MKKKSEKSEKWKGEEKFQSYPPTFNGVPLKFSLHDIFSSPFF